MKRLNQFILIASFLPFCWFAMMTVHELGHIIAGYLSGGNVNKVVIHPLAISRTDVSPNPMPLLVAWAGPLIGIVLPLTAWGVLRCFKIPGDYLARFFAGFCLIANGAYIGIGSFDKVGDAGDLLWNGSSSWELWLFGIVTIPIGFLLWHGIGPKFGLGEANGKVDEWAAYLSLALFSLMFVVTFAMSPRF